MRTLVAGLLALSLGGLALAQDDKKKPEGQTQAERLKAVQKEVTDSLSVALKAQTNLQKVQKDKDADADAKKAAQEEFQKAVAAYQKARQTAGEKAIEIAKADPKTEAAADALAWGVGNATPGQRKEIVGLIREHHLGSAKIGPLVQSMAMAAATDKDAREFIEEVVEKNPHKDIKAGALYGLGLAIKRQAAPYDGPAPKNLDELVQKADAYLTRVVKEFGDVAPAGRKTTYAEMAKAQLAGLKNIALLQIGKVAPDILGEDADGKPFKLSDYRGKVVVLDFWGHW